MVSGSYGANANTVHVCVFVCELLVASHCAVTTDDLFCGILYLRGSVED